MRRQLKLNKGEMKFLGFDEIPERYRQHVKEGIEANMARLIHSTPEMEIARKKKLLAEAVWRYLNAFHTYVSARRENLPGPAAKRTYDRVREAIGHTASFKLEEFFAAPHKERYPHLWPLFKKTLHYLREDESPGVLTL